MMFATLLENIRSTGSHDMPARRKHERRDCDEGVTIIGERMYPLVDWSMGGMQISGDERLFGVDQQIDLVMKFRVHDSVVDVPHRARVVRKAKNKIAFEFLPLTRNVKNKFQSVIDDFVARQFVESQLV